MEHQAEAQQDKILQLSLDKRMNLIANEIGATFSRTAFIAGHPLLQEGLQLAAAGDDIAAKAILNNSARFLVGNEVTAIAFYEDNGQELTRSGIFSNQPELIVPLDHFPGHVQLMWDGQLLLRSVV